MKDYSFGDKEYKKNFVKFYGVINDKVLIFYASGRIEKVDFTYDLINELEKKLASQIEDAVAKFELSYMISKKNELNNLEMFLKAKDIYKNKLLLENLEGINESIITRNLHWATKISNIGIQDLLIWPMYRTLPERLTLNDGHWLSYSHICEIINNLPEEYVKTRSMQRNSKVS